MEKILISACLIGDKTKYDGGHNKTPLLDALLEKYELVPFCPEVEGGLKIPRQPSERKDDKVISKAGKDVTDNFLEGAHRAYMICAFLNIKVAILKDGSPSCGVYEIYDGSFSHKKIEGQGMTAEYLRKMGIQVISENEIEEFLNKEKAE